MAHSSIGENMADTERKTAATSAKGVAALLKTGLAGEHRAADGLYLKITSENKGSWFLRYQLDGKRQKMGIGNAGTGGLTLADARAKAVEFQALVIRGVNPLHDRQKQQIEAKAKAISFDQVAADYISAKTSEWRKEKQARDWRYSIKTYASPVIGNKPPSEITTEDLLKILQPIWQTKHETASKVRGRIEIILNAAKARKLREGENVATWRGHLELFLPKLGKNIKHMPALPHEQISALWEMLGQSNAMAAPVIQFKLLTCVRSSEVRGAAWSEIDFNAKLWTIPAHRMKAGKEHRVPLSPAAITLLNSQPRTESDLIFEGKIADRPLSDMTLSVFLKRADQLKHQKDGIGWRDKEGSVIVPHGFRSTFRDWAAECTHYQNHVVEKALSHDVGSDVERAYRRGDLLGHRRELMEAWANYVATPQAANVVQIRQVKHG